MGYAILIFTSKLHDPLTRLPPPPLNNIPPPPPKEKFLILPSKDFSKNINLSPLKLEGQWGGACHVIYLFMTGIPSYFGPDIFCMFC